MTQSLKSQSSSTDEEIQSAVEQGPITNQYLSDPQKVFSSLNRLRSMEIISICNINSMGTWRYHCCRRG